VPAVADCAITLEQKYGIPTAPFTTEAFISVVRDDRKAGFVPFLFTPHPVIGMSDEQLDAYVSGPNPDTGRPVIQDIIDNLTKPVDPKKLKFKAASAGFSGKPGAFLKPDTEENLQQLFYDRGWTDGLPIVLPTAERVQKMLAGTGAAPDEAVGEWMRFDIRGMVRYTVANVAVIAVMAGAKPGHLWMTLQAHINIVAVAALTDTAAVIVTEGATPEPEVLEKANSQGVTLLGTNEGTYQVVGKLWEMGIRP